MLKISVPSATVPGTAAPGTAAPGTAAPGTAVQRADLLAVEEPLEIRIGGIPLTVTMRTPGDDIDLAAGFLFGEGLIDPAGPQEIRMCDKNVADVTLAAAPLPQDVERATDARRAQRNFLTTSACGVCGKESIESIRVQSRYDIAADPVRVSPEVLASLPDRLREAQRVFASTGGLHAAGLFSPDGTLLVLREDVGRHNAVDKVVGWALRTAGCPWPGTSCWSAAGPPLSSCRRPAWPASPCWPRYRPPPRWPPAWPRRPA